MKSSSSRSGIALVLVLSFLLLLTILITAFFFSVRSQTVISEATAAGALTEQLADSAVNVVMAQIVDATKGVTSSNDAFLSWASQPGMIRTYDTTGAQRNFYKLYSSEKMVADGTFTGDLIPDDWNSLANRDLYTDLNQPAAAVTGDLVYPIVDPGADGTVGPNDTVNTTVKVDGFSITSPKSFKSDKAESPTNNRAAMPVQWLYQLRDGSLHAATGGKSTVTVADATVTNPIVGRIAFWTDDECSKLNLNTASEGTYWDIPRIWTVEDYGSLAGPGVLDPTKPGFGCCQPAQHEFQRYPGHPATTCLSPVFGSLPNMDVPYPWPAAPTATLAKKLDPYYNIAPRIGLPSLAGGGGSLGGSALYTDSTGQTEAIKVDTDRLYASVEEAMFSSSTGTPGAARGTNNFSNNSIALIPHRALEKTRFFLTVSSSAPEVTLYGTPRISIWPVWKDITKRMPYDKLSAFCSTILPTGSVSGSDAGNYYFTRQNSRSQTADLSTRNLALYKYLQKMTSTPVPGFGGTFQAKYPAPTGNAATNGQIGVKSNATECDQILTEIFDYIRCTSLQDRSTTPDNTLKATPFTLLYNKNANLGAGEAIPIRMPNGTQGFGRFYSISSANLLFYSTDDIMPPQQNANGTTTYFQGPAAKKMRAILLLQYFSPAQGMAVTKANLRYRVTGLDKLQLQMPGLPPQSLNFKAGGSNYIDVNGVNLNHCRGIGGSELATLGLVGTVNYSNQYGSNKLMQDLIPNSPEAGGDAHNKYPFFSASDILIPQKADKSNPAKTVPSSPFFTFIGNPTSDIVVQISGADDATAAPIQTIHLRFPPTKLAMPQNAPYQGPGYMKRILVNSYMMIDGSQANNYAEKMDKAGTPDGSDTVVGLQVNGAGLISGSSTPSATAQQDPTAGDQRLVAASQEVPVRYFRAHNDYANNNTNGTQFAHGMIMDIGEYCHGGKYGKLSPVPNAPTSLAAQANGYIRAYFQGTSGATCASQPDVPSRALNGVYRVDGGPGDWDTGYGDQPDGAHINKPDEGDSIFTDPQSNGWRPPYSVGDGQGYSAAVDSYFSPSRMVPSPMMFGSLSTGVRRVLPWQTLSFAPRPEDKTHPGNVGLRDHLLADLFWMPVVEPYAISQPFATSGKINLNSQIQPFTNIKRETALYGVLKSTKFAAVPLSYGTTPSSTGPTYKPIDAVLFHSTTLPNIRRALDLTATVGAITKRFGTGADAGKLYKSATEICEVNMIPQGQTDATMATFWSAKPGSPSTDYRLTGDNLREKPYVDIYPRLTTKSNTFTVHVRVQTLKKTRGTPVTQWVSGTDQVLGEFRGSTTLERYVDLSDTTMPDFATAFTGVPNTSPSIDSHYKMRVVSTRRFTP